MPVALAFEAALVAASVFRHVGVSLEATAHIRMERVGVALEVPG